jgi:repressor LexA
MKKQLNKKGKEVFDFLVSQINEKGYPPSVREICKAVDLKSTSTVHSYLSKLEKMGLIEKDPSKPRALKILNSQKTNNVVNIPIVGKVTAGEPILAVENIEDTFPLPANFIPNSTTFILRVSGESMIDAGILDNDFVIVQQQNTAQNGEIVVALIEDEATVKTFYKEIDHIRLQPENKYMEPIIIKENIKLLGKVVGVFRKM